MMNDKLKITRTSSPNYSNAENKMKKDNQSSASTFLTSIFQYFSNAINSSKPAKEYLASRALDLNKLVTGDSPVGYNSGQFHHGARRDEQLISQALEVGLLIDKNLVSKTGNKAYGVFGNKSLVFPLKNERGDIVSFYFRSILSPLSGDLGGKHFYLKNRQGLYPHYPSREAKKLILTEAIIDAASFLCHPELVEGYSILACYGTNGLTEEHQRAIKEWIKTSPLGIEGKEIIFAFDNDTAGKESTLKYAEKLQSMCHAELSRSIRITTLDLPNKDVNEVLQLHEPAIFEQLLRDRAEVGKLEKEFSFSTEISNETALQFVNTNEKNKLISNQKEKIIASGGSPLDFLKQDHLLFRINELIGKSGIVGEEENRLLMFVVASTYKMNYNLHVLYQGSSGSGKSHTMKQIAKMMPSEDVIELTRVTDSSLYNYQGGEFMQKLIVFEDMDGLKEDALLAVREMMSAGKLSSSTSIKDKRGNSKGAIKEVEVSFASLSATTKGELYEDNMSRIIVLSVDESNEQVQRIINY
ncbi:MAG: toprim domain-containing protein, partial [Bdellovibrionales bacterium]|nr:toprim domain-containing protein [Bdellovibrionales bacterium]